MTEPAQQPLFEIEKPSAPSLKTPKRRTAKPAETKPVPAKTKAELKQVELQRIRERARVKAALYR